jgi:hypothetical protein
MTKDFVKKKNSPPAFCYFPQLSASDVRGQLRILHRKLEDSGTLHIPVNQNGVYAASASQTGDSPTGYQDAWLRDNAMIAFSRWQCGDSESAFKTLQGLTTFLKTQAHKMEAIIDHPELGQNVQRRPHVRFNAKTLKELGEGWACLCGLAEAPPGWQRPTVSAEPA